MRKLQTVFLKTKLFINRYTISAILFVIFLMIGDHSIINSIKLKHKVAQLEKERNRYKTNISKTLIEIEELNTNKSNIEQLAREKYLMRKKNEDVFIIKEK